MATPFQQTAFNAGELSKRLRGRVDAELYRRGLDYCANFEPLPQGSLMMRGPFEHIAPVNPDLGTTVRLIPFRAAGKQDAVFVIGDQKMRIYKADGGEIVTIGPELINPGGFPPWVAVAGTPTYNTTTKKFSLDQQESMRYTAVATQAGVHRLNAKGQAIGWSYHTVNFNIGTTPGGGELFNGTQWFGSGSYGSMNQITVNVPGAGNIYITVTSTMPGSPPTIAQLGDFSFRAAQSTAGIVTPWTKEQLSALQYASETGRDRMIIVHPNVEPRVITYDGDVTWTFQTLTAAMTAENTQATKPAAWTGTNWPATIEFHQSRSWWSGTPTERNKVWASKSTSILDFGVSNPLVASDAITQTLATRGAMKWFKGKKHLIVGTDEGEHSFVANGGALSPTDIHAEDESSFGSAGIMPVSVGSRVAYVSADRRKVRALSFSLEENGWVQKDITFIGEHLTKDLILELHYAKDPNGTLVALLESGWLAMCTFDESEQVIAWWRCSTDGDIGSACVSNGPEGSAIWAAVSRVNGLMLERLWTTERAPRYTLDQFYTGVLEDHLGMGGKITGATHLANQTVWVIHDGSLYKETPATLAQFVVTAGGELIMLDEDMGFEIQLGVPVIIGVMPADVKSVTLPKNTRSGKAHSPKIGLLLNESAFPIVNGKRVAPDRTPATPQGQPEPLYSGKVDCTNGEWDEEGKITITQDVPFRTEILSIYEITNVKEM